LRALDLIEATAKLASPTGQWPEAIHPRTLGGCMGDGQHVWAAAEWIMVMRNLFIREEKDALVIGAGVRPEWFQKGGAFGVAETLTGHGKVSVEFQVTSQAEAELRLSSQWHDSPPRLDIRVPGFTVTPAEGGLFHLHRS
jgi:hypothetical protein